MTILRCQIYNLRQAKPLSLSPLQSERTHGKVNRDFCCLPLGAIPFPLLQLISAMRIFKRDAHAEIYSEYGFTTLDREQST